MKDSKHCVWQTSLSGISFRSLLSGYSTSESALKCGTHLLLARHIFRKVVHREPVSAHRKCQTFPM